MFTPRKAEPVKSESVECDSDKFNLKTTWNYLKSFLKKNNSPSPCRIQPEICGKDASVVSCSAISKTEIRVTEEVKKQKYRNENSLIECDFLEESANFDKYFSKLQLVLLDDDEIPCGRIEKENSPAVNSVKLKMINESLEEAEASFEKLLTKEFLEENSTISRISLSSDDNDENVSFTSGRSSCSECSWTARSGEMEKMTNFSSEGVDDLVEESVSM